MNSQHRLSGTRLAKYHQPLWGGLLPKIEADICQNTDSVRASGSKPRFCLKFEVHHRIRLTAQLIEKNLLAAINRVREAIGKPDKHRSRRIRPHASPEPANDPFHLGQSNLGDSTHLGTRHSCYWNWRSSPITSSVWPATAERTTVTPSQMRDASEDTAWRLVVPGPARTAPTEFAKPRRCRPTLPPTRSPPLIMDNCCCP